MKAEVISQTDYTELRISGKLDLKSTREFRNALLEALKIDKPELQINFEEISYIDSAGLGMLLMAREMADAGGKKISLTQTTGIVRSAMDLAKFGTLFKLS